MKYQATITTLRRYAKYPHISSLLVPELENAADAIEELQAKLEVAKTLLQSIAECDGDHQSGWWASEAKNVLEQIK